MAEAVAFIAAKDFAAEGRDYHAGDPVPEANDWHNPWLSVSQGYLLVVGDQHLTGFAVPRYGESNWATEDEAVAYAKARQAAIDGVTPEPAVVEPEPANDRPEPAKPQANPVKAPAKARAKKATTKKAR